MCQRQLLLGAGCCCCRVGCCRGANGRCLLRPVAYTKPTHLVPCPLAAAVAAPQVHLCAVQPAVPRGRAPDRLPAALLLPPGRPARAGRPRLLRLGRRALLAHGRGGRGLSGARAGGGCRATAAARCGCHRCSGGRCCRCCCRAGVALHPAPPPVASQPPPSRRPPTGPPNPALPAVPGLLAAHAARRGWRHALRLCLGGPRPVHPDRGGGAGRARRPGAGHQVGPARRARGCRCGDCNAGALA